MYKSKDYAMHDSRTGTISGNETLPLLFWLLQDSHGKLLFQHLSPWTETHRRGQGNFEAIFNDQFILEVPQDSDLNLQVRPSLSLTPLLA